MSKILAALKIDDLADTRRRSVLIKQSQFATKKNGKRHHTFDKEKAPYPLSYDRTAVELDIIDHVFLTQVRNSVSFVDFKDEPPSRCLDLGCGTGTWIIDACKEWPDCEFVGFDLVNIQPPYSVLDSNHRKRVQWVHGNFLTTKLPFDDDEFDHVHIRSIARAVPESKWNYLFEEISRVLRPGGSIEMIEDDILFPSLPNWYTRGLRARDRKTPSVQLSTGSIRTTSSLPLSPPLTPPRSELPHDHTLLESLYSSVFETRFINLNPTSILPSYFNTYFRHVLCSPVINFPMPPLPCVPTFNIATSLQDHSAPSSDAKPMRSHRQEGSSSSLMTHSDISSDGDAEDSPVQQITPPTSDDEQQSAANLSKARALVVPYHTSPSDDTSIADTTQLALLPLSSLSQASQFMLALQLHRSYNFVLACEESMWEVLNDRIRNREEDLKRLGWDDDDFESAHARQRFETLLERYKGDMQTRAAIWQSMVLAQSPSWKLPTPGFLGKAEQNDEDRLFQSLLDAQMRVSEEELRNPCRTLRIFVGYNA